MILPPPRDDAEYTFARAHDLDEIWDPSRQPHVASSHTARFSLLRSLVSEITQPPARILDVGCAQGTLGLQLAEGGYRVTLVDLRASHVEYAKARYERGDVEFFVGQVGPGVPPAGEYDVVVCTEVLEHVQSAGTLLGQLRDKTARSGAILLTTPNADYALSHLPTFARAPQEVIDQAEANSRDGDSHRFLFSREELVSVVRAAGLRVERTGYFLPFWLEGHMKTRYLHRLYFNSRGKPLSLPGTLDPLPARFGRYLCSSQYLVARRPQDD
jgi:2-polyprenyl-3-methyl-5-hydroxy-6-metoxy-1,4-benzoquinol methylase